MNSSLPQGPADQPKSPGARMRRARLAKKWSLRKCALHFRQEALRRGYPAPSVASLIPMISKWENDKQEPDEYNRRILAIVLGVTVADLGLPEDPDFIM